MKIVLLTILIGAAAGLIDIIPMIKMKIDKYPKKIKNQFHQWL